MAKPDELLHGSAPSRIADLAEYLAPEALEEIERSLLPALRGDGDEVRAYVGAYRRLGDRILEAIDKDRARTSPLIRAILQGEAISAPFTEWVGSLDPGRGTAVAMVELLRSNLPDSKPLSRPAKRRLPAWEIDEADVVRFRRAVLDAIESAELPLERIRNVMGLNRTELAALFGVRRQALDSWQLKGIPAERQARLGTIGAIADLLSTQLKADRIPAVVRRPAPGYGNRSILEAIAAGAEADVLAALRDGFDWSRNA